MASSRNALGRGLGALLPGAGSAPTPEEPVPADARHEVESPRHEIRVDDIDANPEQPRQHFDPDHLQQLAESIRRHGLLQPVVVRRAGERYELVVGERRWRATRAAGLPRIPAVVLDVDPADRLELALIENVQRRDLNPIELAEAFRTLAERGASQQQIGEKMGLDRSSVSNHLRLLELPRELQQDVEDGRLAVGHAKALLGLGNPERRRHLRDRIVDEGLSVRAAEELSREQAGPRPARRKAPAAADPNTQELADSLRDALQTKVRIVGRGKKGRIEIEYFGADELDRLVQRLLDA